MGTDLQYKMMLNSKPFGMTIDFAIIEYTTYLTMYKLTIFNVCSFKEISIK